MSHEVDDVLALLEADIDPRVLVARLRAIDPFPSSQDLWDAIRKLPRREPPFPHRSVCSISELEDAQRYYSRKAFGALRRGDERSALSHEETAGLYRQERLNRT